MKAGAKLRSWSIRSRLIVLSLALIAVAGSANLLLGHLIAQEKPNAAALREQYRRFEIIQSTAQAVDAWRHFGGDVDVAIVAKDAPAEQAARSRLAMATRESLQWIRRLATFDPQSAAAVQDAFDALRQRTDESDVLLAEGRVSDIVGELPELQRLATAIASKLHAAAAVQRHTTEAIQDREDRRIAAAVRYAVLTMLGAGALGIALAFAIVRTVGRSLKDATRAVRQVNAGHSVIDLPPVTGDESGELAVALRQFRDGADRLKKLAFEDSLTGLGAGNLLDTSLREAIEAARAAGECVALLHVDLDNVRAVNDRLGYQLGNRYLCEAVARLRRFTPADAVLCRFGADQFTVLLKELAAEDCTAKARKVAETALHGLSERYVCGDAELTMSAAIGIALFPADGDSAEQILSAADAAAYAARRSGANCIRFASARFAAATRKHLALVNDIRRGLEQGEFHPFYQPIVDIDRGSVVGAEALLRWRHSERGLLLPGEFIEAAEESGLIVGLSERCLAAVHRQSREWALAGRPLRIAVNLSGRQINNGELLGMLARLEPAADAARPLLDFELTESLLLEASETAEKTLEAVKALGCGIGLDDFGTGYSSFAYLRRLPIDTIKIDRQFVAAMHNSRQAVAIIAALIALAKNLELKIVAEGVETAEQMWLLRKMGCPLQQGFHFTKALPAEDFERWMAGFGRQTLSDAPGSGMRSAVNR